MERRGRRDVPVGSVCKKGFLQITVDSGAGASCWPAELMPEVPLKTKQRGVRFQAANGEDLRYHGRKTFTSSRPVEDHRATWSFA